mgnify:CR=1 FL=1
MQVNLIRISFPDASSHTFGEARQEREADILTPNERRSILSLSSTFPAYFHSLYNYCYILNLSLSSLEEATLLVSMLPLLLSSLSSLAVEIVILPHFLSLLSLPSLHSSLATASEGFGVSVNVTTLPVNDSVSSPASNSSTNVEISDPVKQIIMLLPLICPIAEKLDKSVAREVGIIISTLLCECEGYLLRRNADLPLCLFLIFFYSNFLFRFSFREWLTSLTTTSMMSISTATFSLPASSRTCGSHLDLSLF